jgi:hypothetical protein
VHNQRAGIVGALNVITRVAKREGYQPRSRLDGRSKRLFIGLERSKRKVDGERPVGEFARPFEL